MTIAYILNTYPQPSHSFIRREIRALETSGLIIKRIAMRRPTMPLVDPQDISEEGQTDYVLERGSAQLIRGALGRVLRHPGAALKALKLAWQMGGRSPQGRLRHLIYWVEACAVANDCNSLNIDHAHAHFGTNSAAVAMLSHEMNGPSYSFTVHGPEEFDAPEALSLGTKLQKARFSVAISQFGRSQLSRLVHPDIWTNIKVVHCGIEPAKFAEPIAITNGKLRMVSIGRFSEQKGQISLIKAMEKVVTQNPDAHLTLIGDGPLRAEIEQAIDQSNLGQNITLTGWLSEDGVQQELIKAQALVMPSFAEGLPMVIMEAMATARPVIATFVAGIPELVLPGETGWLVPAGDVDALVDAIDELAQTNVADLIKMGRIGRERAFERHDVTKEAAKLAAHFADGTHG